MPEHLRLIRSINLVLTAVGTLVFAALFLYIALAPQDFDQRTRDFAIGKVEDKLDAQLSAPANSKTADKIADFAGKYFKRLEGEIEKLQDSLDAGFADFIADVLAAACKLDCARRDAAAKSVTAFFETEVARHGVALGQLTDLIEGNYDTVMRKLRGDLKIFSGSSFAVLFFAFLLAVFRGRASAQLLPFSLALTLATVLATTWYLLGQDWIMTLIYSDYWGWAYPIALLVIAGFLIDVAINKARVTTRVLNALANIVGSSLHFVPC